MTDPIEYNRMSSLQYGWKPSWFGCINIDLELISAIRAYQRFNALSDDGLVGPSTFRRLFADREKDIDDHTPIDAAEGDKFIVYNGNFFPIEWDKVVLWSEDNGLAAKPGAYRRVDSTKRRVNMFVNHWDVCLSSRACQSVLDNRGISVQFLIDNDGTIYQTMDAQHIAYHAGNLNKCTVGVEISNAYYMRHNRWYEKHGFGKRPINTRGLVNGAKLEPFLDFYDVQKRALQALWAACHKAMSIPLQTVLNEDGLMSTDTEHITSSGRFRGIVHHYHLTNRKIDCGGLDILDLLEGMTDG